MLTWSWQRRFPRTRMTNDHWVVLITVLYRTLDLSFQDERGRRQIDLASRPEVKFWFRRNMMLVVIVVLFLSRNGALFNVLSRGDYRLHNKIPFDQIEECVLLMNHSRPLNHGLWSLLFFFADAWLLLCQQPAPLQLELEQLDRVLEVGRQRPESEQERTL